MGLRTVQMSLKSNQDALHTDCMMITNHRRHYSRK
jgi:hypothetical protein